MIYTVTFNPAIDYVLRLEHSALDIGTINRPTSYDFFAGGKGINVSRILNRLGTPNIATGFVGGFSGEYIKTSLANENIDHHFIPIAGNTRINVKLQTTENTEINTAGPDLTDEEFERYLTYFDVLKDNDIVVISGSISKSLGNKGYQKIIEKIKSKHADFVIDIDSDYLIESLSDAPLLIKPNIHELATLYQTKIKTADDALPYAKDLLNKGAKNVIVSMGDKGAILLSAEEAYFAKKIDGTPKNLVGAGDSMVAGFVSTYSQGGTLLEAFTMGVACATATAFSEDLADLPLINALKEHVVITTLTTK